MRGLRFRGCFGLKVKETVEILSLTLIFPLFEYFPKVGKSRLSSEFRLFLLLSSQNNLEIVILAYKLPL